MAIATTTKGLAALLIGAVAFGLAAGAVSAGDAARTAKSPKAKAKVSQVSSPFLLPVGEADALARCPEDSSFFGGGVLTGAPLTSAIEILGSSQSIAAWQVHLRNDSGLAQLASVQAICLRDRIPVKGLEEGARALPKPRRGVAMLSLPPDASPTEGVAEATATCPTGTTVLSGGGTGVVFGKVGTDVELLESGPEGNGWHVRLDNDEPVSESAFAGAMCIRNKLKVSGASAKAHPRVVRATRQVVLPPSEVGQGRAEFDIACEAGTSVVGGGGRFAPGAPLEATAVQLEESGPAANGWHVRFDNDESTSRAATIHALCLRSALKVK